ncbi:MAG: lysylphosphatidylglycerol synthase transmembrane domain-containing protein [Thermodesulfobacteriota bacterium]
MKRMIGICISLGILAVIFLKIDINEFIHNFKNINLLYFAISLMFFVPQTYVSAKRWQLILDPQCVISLWKSATLILASSTLNVILPSKVGDFAKALFLKRSDGLELSKGFSLTFIEKILDVAGLCVVLLVGAIFIPNGNSIVRLSIVFSFCIITLTIFMFSYDMRRLKLNWLASKIGVEKRLNAFLDEWQQSVSAQRRDKERFIMILSFTIFLWFLHIGQIYLFFLSLNSAVSPMVVFTYVPLSIFVGLIPISFGGIGTRDAALIYLFSPYESSSVMAGIGILCSFRYFVPALFGLPFLGRLGFKPQEIKRESLNKVA